MSSKRKIDDDKESETKTVAKRIKTEDRGEEDHDPIDLKLAYWSLLFAMPDAQFTLCFEPSQNSNKYRCVRFHEGRGIAEMVRVGAMRRPRIDCIRYQDGQWKSASDSYPCDVTINYRSLTKADVRYITRRGATLLGNCVAGEFHYQVNIASELDGVNFAVTKKLELPSRVADLLVILEQNSNSAASFTDRFFWEKNVQSGRDILERQLVGIEFQRHLLPVVLMGLIFDYLYESCIKRDGKKTCKKFLWGDCLECSESS